VPAARYEPDRRWLWRVPSAARLTAFVRKVLESEPLGPKLRVEHELGRADDVQPAVPTVPYGSGRWTILRERPAA